MPPLRKSRTGLFAGLAVVLVLLLAGAGTGAFLLSKRTDNASSATAPATAARWSH